MTLSRMRATSRRRLSWLVWLGLLFAFAQVAASAHAISHLSADAGRSREGGAVHAQCDLCLLGASIGGAAPATEPPIACHPDLGDVAYVDELRPFVASAPALAYRSRAPPTAPR
ncbi:MAG TPA: hypothetical protein VGI48_00875 [Caldimonas sp.]|jgi:hypothetical protein